MKMSNLNKIKKELEAIKNLKANNKLGKPFKYSTMVIDGELTLEEAWELYQADESNYLFKDVDGLILESGIETDEEKKGGYNKMKESEMIDYKKKNKE